MMLVCRPDNSAFFTVVQLEKSKVFKISNIDSSIDLSAHRLTFVMKKTVMYPTVNIALTIFTNAIFGLIIYNGVTFCERH